MSTLTFFQQDAMEKIAAIPDIQAGALLHISHRKYPKYQKDRDYEGGYTEPIEIHALRVSAKVLRNKGFLRTGRSYLFILTEKGMQYIDEMRAL